jgi:hypothetical protein
MPEILTTEIEAVMSPLSLAQDEHLAHQLGPDLSVPISALLETRRLRDLLSAYANPYEILVEAARSSNKLSIDSAGERIRPRVHLPRTTVVVRNIGASELRETLDHADISDHNFWVSQQSANMFYVRCPSEEVAADLARHLQTRKIQASIKNESLVKSVYVEPVPIVEQGRKIKRYSIEDFTAVSGRSINHIVADPATRTMLINSLHVLKPV